MSYYVFEMREGGTRRYVVIRDGEEISFENAGQARVLGSYPTQEQAADVAGELNSAAHWISTARARSLGTDA